MFWALSVVSMLAYSLQNVLMVHHIRQMDAWSAAMYRTLSLGISMLPLLIYAGWQETVGIVAVWPQVWLASLFGAGALAMAFSMLQFLPVGISTAISSGVRTIITILIAWWWLGENLSAGATLMVGVILAATFWLGAIRQKQKDVNLRAYDLGKGIIFVLVQGILVSLAFILFAEAARHHNPLVVSYFWELQIGLCLLMIGLGRWWVFKKPLEKISWSTFHKIFWVCSPTLVGTGAFALAANQGPIGIVSAISVGSIFVSAVMAYWWYHEKPMRIEWLGMGFIALAILGLKLI